VPALSHFRLGWLLPFLALLAAAASAADPAVPIRPKLDPKRVLELAAVAFSKRSEPTNHFTPKAPQFVPEKHSWRVYYIQNSAPFIPDGDVLVVVDDDSGSTCSQNAAWPGPCT